ncbi:Ger(x)C family spore germination protein [Paenibacillus prosopidis]|uniref:Ger(X)C family germination protein n=1 Tax=Paenibacillus prosopidis TaxID=630520 RepID=A0A368VTU0_9BACL|nr:Ger(x)C family spore germination protein [Paenibacillus prosopidis]RCW45476.1 Ger(x)C family germination protein [Paenibacillus prosopidis]
MNVRLLFTLLIICISLTGCSDEITLENAATPLAHGIDLDEHNKFRFYNTVPLFSKTTKKKSQENSGTAYSLRQSKAQQDAFSPGSIQGRNYQVLLIGKRLLQYEDWFPMLDVLFRDARNTVMDRVIAVDSPLSDVFDLNSKDQPMLPILLRGMVETKSKISETYSTTTQELHRQFHEKGITPYIAEVEIVEKKIKLKGSALLNERGKYEVSFGAQETVMLNILQKKAKPGLSLSYRIPDKPNKGPFATDMLSFSAEKIKTKVITSFQNGRFQFDFHIKMTIGLSEHLFPYDVARDAKKLEKQAAALMQAQIENVIKKLQKHQIDPIGLGLYARAFHYKEYKKVKDHWGKAVADATFHVKVDLTIGAMGPVK